MVSPDIVRNLGTSATTPEIIKLRRVLAFVGVFVALFTSVAFAKEDVTVVIEVKDITGAVIQGAEVSVSQEKSKVIVAHTDGKGLASLRIKPGKYEVTVEMRGFRKVTESFSVTDTDRQVLAIRLQVASCPPGPCIEVQPAAAR